MALTSCIDAHTTFTNMIITRVMLEAYTVYISRMLSE